MNATLVLDGSGISFKKNEDHVPGSLLRGRGEVHKLWKIMKIVSAALTIRIPNVNHRFIAIRH